MARKNDVVAPVQHNEAAMIEDVLVSESFVDAPTRSSERTKQSGITMSEFLATSMEVRRYSAYLQVGFNKYVKTRSLSAAIPYRQPYEDWLRLFEAYAQSND